MWKQKQTVIDLEDYLGKPMPHCPMSIFPHFHWISLEGKRPNIAENFIKDKQKKEDKKVTFNIKNEKKEADDDRKLNISNNVTNIKIDTINKNINNYYYNYNNETGKLSNYSNLNNFKSNDEANEFKPTLNSQYNTLNLNEKSHVISPVIHNITKELQIFQENFELRFRKEMKKIKLENNKLNNLKKLENEDYKEENKLTKELEISLTAIKNQPGLVELLPYILEFLMNLFQNKQNLKEIKVLLLIVYSLKSVILNPYFNLSPYLHQIISILMSLILLAIHNQISLDLITLKIEASSLVLILYKKFEFLYPEFIKQILIIIEKCIVLNEEKPRLASLFGAINVS